MGDFNLCCIGFFMWKEFLFVFDVDVVVVFEIFVLKLFMVEICWVLILLFLGMIKYEIF